VIELPEGHLHRHPYFHLSRVAISHFELRPPPALEVDHGDSRRWVGVGGQVILGKGVDLNNPLYAIAKKGYEGVWFANGRMRRQNFAGQIAEFVEHYEVDGVITLMATTCRVSTGLLHQRRLINEYAGVPVLNLEADMSDVRTFSEAHIKGRLDAFLETIDAAKER